MSAPVADPVDQIMGVMEAAFDPAWGEAWNRKQVSDALALGNCHYLLVDEAGGYPASGPAAGFLLSRRAAGEEELLLIAVRPECRRCGLATILIGRFLADAKLGGVEKVFLEMREGNPAAQFYAAHGFTPVGRRLNYYNRGKIRGIDAITYAREITAP